MEAFGHCNGFNSSRFSSGLTEIAERAFLWCSSLTAVALPESLTDIGEGAFYGCTGLNSIDITGRLYQNLIQSFYIYDEDEIFIYRQILMMVKTYYQSWNNVY